jgi:hypothetical protein
VCLSQNTIFQSTTNDVLCRFASIVKPKYFYEMHARKDIRHDGTRNNPRCYFYNIDLQGRLFLEETLPKNIATSIKDNRFLDFFFTRLKYISASDRAWMADNDISVDDYPFVSVCGKERNLIRPAASPVVFHSIVDTDGRRNLVFGGSSTLVQPFDEVAGIAISEQTGKLYHQLTTHSLQHPTRAIVDSASRQEYGLIRSSVAVALSEQIVVMNENEATYRQSKTHSGLGFATSGELLPIPWLPAHAEPGSWAMPFAEENDTART